MVFLGGPSGFSPVTLRPFAGAASFASAVSGLGDVDGDGYADLAVCTELSGVGVYRGSAGGPIASPQILRAPPAGGSFGQSIASADDVPRRGEHGRYTLSRMIVGLCPDVPRRPAPRRQRMS